MKKSDDVLVYSMLLLAGTGLIWTCIAGTWWQWVLLAACGTAVYLVTKAAGDATDAYEQYRRKKKGKK